MELFLVSLYICQWFPSAKFLEVGIAEPKTMFIFYRFSYKLPISPLETFHWFAFLLPKHEQNVVSQTPANLSIIMFAVVAK